MISLSPSVREQIVVITGVGPSNGPRRKFREELKNTEVVRGLVPKKSVCFITLKQYLEKMYKSQLIRLSLVLVHCAIEHLALQTSVGGCGNIAATFVILSLA